MIADLFRKTERITMIARLTVLENSRKHVFHVLLIAALAVICSSTLLSFFTLGVQIKILKDLSITSIIICGGLLTVALASSGMTGELENRTLYPVLARPIVRGEFLIGKYLGTLATVYAGLTAIILAFAIILVRHGGHIDAGFMTAIAFALLQVALIAAVATLLSVMMTSAMASMLALLIYICGSIKMGYLQHLADSAGGVAKTAFMIFYHILPNLESFNFKDALIHGLPVPGAYLIHVAIYGVVYASIALMVASEVLARKEL